MSTYWSNLPLSYSYLPALEAFGFPSPHLPASWHSYQHLVVQHGGIYNSRLHLACSVNGGKGIWIVHPKPSLKNWAFQACDAKQWCTALMTKYSESKWSVVPSGPSKIHLARTFNKKQLYKVHKKNEESPQVMIYLPHTAMHNCLNTSCFFVPLKQRHQVPEPRDVDLDLIE